MPGHLIQFADDHETAKCIDGEIKEAIQTFIDSYCDPFDFFDGRKEVVLVISNGVETKWTAGYKVTFFAEKVIREDV